MNWSQSVSVRPRLVSDAACICCVCISLMSLCALFIFPECVESEAHVPSCVYLPSAVWVTCYQDYKYTGKYHHSSCFGSSVGAVWMYGCWSFGGFICIVHILILITLSFCFCLCRCFVSPGPFQSLHREPANVCGQQGGCLCPAGVEDAGTVPARYLCGQHLWTQWVQNSVCGPGYTFFFYHPASSYYVFNLLNSSELF